MLQSTKFVKHLRTLWKKRSPVRQRRLRLEQLESRDLLAGILLPGQRYMTGYGPRAAGIVDLNGDGFDDLIIGARLGDGPGNTGTNAGEAIVVSNHIFERIFTDAPAGATVIDLTRADEVASASALGAAVRRFDDPPD